MVFAQWAGYPILAGYDKVIYTYSDGSSAEFDSLEEAERVTVATGKVLSSAEMTTKGLAGGSLIPVTMVTSFVGLIIYTGVRERSKIGRWFSVSLREIAFGIVGAAGLLGIGALYTLVLGWFDYRSQDFMTMLTDGLPMRGLMLVGGVVLAPMAEELYFRGRLFDLVSRSRGPAVAVLVTSVCFGIMHMIPVYVPITMLMGALLGYLRHVSKGLVAPILAHALNNLVAFL
ncbi:MAG: CPBP family intramembrane metalloprotease [bacterium]|nr:CPBP family intramembrane metalloprotease [bacterium]